MTEQVTISSLRDKQRNWINLNTFRETYAIYDMINHHCGIGLIKRKHIVKTKVPETKSTIDNGKTRPIMGSNTMTSIHPTFHDFICFCVERRGKEWPAIYDEMASVARQRLFRGLGYDELKRCGLSLCASGADQLREVIARVIADNKES